MLGYSCLVAPALKQSYTALGPGYVHVGRVLRSAQRHGLGDGGDVRLERPHARYIHAGGNQRKDRTISSDDGARRQMLDRALLRGNSPFLTKVVQLLPEADQASLESFSNALRESRSSGSHLDRHYALLRKHNLHQYLTIHAMQRLLKCIASDPGSFYSAGSKPPTDVIVGLIDDYRSLGFELGASEYSSLIRALAAEPGREKEALELVDNIVDNSELAPFLRPRKGKRDQGASVADRIPSDEEIARIDEGQVKAAAATSGAATGRRAPAVNGEESGTGADWIQELVVEQRRARHQGRAQGDERIVRISRSFYHMAMRGFAYVYHVRGVLAILNRMLESATQVPYRIARHLMPNKETWDIVGEVLVRQRDRPTFVRAWIGFLSRGSRPPTGLTQGLVRLLVSQSCVEQAIWVMCISRCLPDNGERSTQPPFSEDTVPWELKVQTMHVASALEAASALDVTHMTPLDALAQGRVAVQLPVLGKPDPEIYAHLIGGAVRMKSAKLAERLFQELVDAGVAPAGATFGHLASLYADRRQTSRVFLIVREVLVQQHKRMVSDELADGSITLAEAQERISRSVRRKASLLRVDVECIVPLLRFYLQSGRDSEALSLLRSWDMIYAHHIPAEKLALALARVYNRSEDAPIAEDIIQRMRDALARDKDSAPAAEGDNQQEQPISHAQGAAASPAAGVAAGADTGVMLQAYLQAIQTHFKARNIPGVIQVLRDITASGHQPPYGMWETIMRGLLREQAFDLFDAVHVYLRDTLRMPLSMPLYSMWMRSLRNHGDVVGTQAAFDEMISMGQVPNQQHYQYLVQVYAYDGWIEQAVAIVSSLRRPNSSLRAGLGIDVAAIEAYVACGDMERAEVELRYLLDNTHLPTNRIPARPFNYLIIGYLHAGNGRKAMRMYEEMVRLGVRPDVYTFAVLMQSYAVANDLANCMRVFNEMVRVGIAPDIVVYTIMICAFGAAKKVLNAEIVFRQILREQAWARSQIAGQGLTRADAPLSNTSLEALDAYADALSAAEPSETQPFADAGSSSPEEQLRLRGFFNLDPVVYIAILIVYRRSGRTMNALATWERMISNFPIVQWNPRQGGIASKSLHFTGRFHIPAWTLLLRTARESIGVTSAAANLTTYARYFVTPLYPAAVAAAMDRRWRQKQAIMRHSGEGSWDPAATARNPSDRMKARLHAVNDIEKELDARTAIDRSFCIHQRYRTSLPALDRMEPFAGFSYWLPNGIDLSALDADPAASAQADASTPANDNEAPATQSPPSAMPSLPSFMTKKGRHAKESAQGIAAIVARQWRSLEDNMFKFTNIHVAEYIPCMLVGRQYDDLLRFLSLVEPAPGSDVSENTPGPPANYRYRNIAIDEYLTRLLVRQFQVVRSQLLAERERRTLLAALLDTSSDLAVCYTRESMYGYVSKQRSDDERQVMHERMVIHCERELSWAGELQMLVDVARAWGRLLPSRDKTYLEKATRRATLLLH
ncbi:hypothetical protein LPJ61_002743 [Coemansia biformis]|uniref:Pentacotripeptide-repeat region of PRORP domain-containing protein n=1 Tax=Coemansia biformis TaxID=1286918 RepID=A0A9W7YDX2_9FUNG|nr:hypothetical protein LPJ61_002743 [Coemansia biformis]